jgi:hypothetical protein
MVVIELLQELVHTAALVTAAKMTLDEIVKYVNKALKTSHIMKQLECFLDFSMGLSWLPM